MICYYSVSSMGRILLRALFLSSATVVLAALPAFAQMMPGAGDRLDAEVGGFPPFLQDAIADYSERLLANVDEFSEMDVSNCHFASDTTALIMQNQRDSIDETLFLEWVVRSRALGYLSIAKFDQNSEPLRGSYAEKAEAGEFADGEVVSLLSQENARCTELLARHAGPVLSRNEANDGFVRQ